MNNLQPLKWGVDEYTGEPTSRSISHGYIVMNDGNGKFKVAYYLLSGGTRTKFATGFITIDDAKEWCWNHYNEKMQSYVKPLPTWIDASKQLPKEDGEYLVLIKGFTYEMGNLDDLQPRIGKWNGGRGCFNEDYGNVLFVAWMPIPEFSEVTK